ncbi:MAG: hypothetical protein J5792_00355, partial [Bacteroidales bacterium]|nr:hypothetical protein [Bacteroidales bacterium]
SINIYKATYTVSDTIICAVPGQTTFNGTGGSTFRWDIFKNGVYFDAGLGMTFKPTFQSEGTYTIRLAATNALKCKDTAYITVHVYDSVPLDITIIDNPHCQPDTPIIFINRTKYTSTDDFGYASTVWNTGDGYPNMYGDSISHVYGNYGRWPIHAYVTTPYGCTYTYTDTMNIFELYVSWRPHLYPKNCIPFRGGVWELEKYTSSPIVQYTWIWGDGDTTVKDSTDIIDQYHVYERTGIYDVHLIVKNAHGCVYKQEYIVTYPVGIPPKTTYIPRDTIDTACIGDLFLYLQAGDSTYRAYDSVFFNGVYIGMDTIDKPIAGVYTNQWNWIAGESGENGILSEYKIDTLSAKKNWDRAGSVTLRLVGKYNQCPGDTILIKDIAYVCPAVARIKSPRRAYYCDYPTVHFIENSDGPVGYLWHFGNDSTSTSGIYWEGDTSTEANPVYSYKPGKYLQKYYAKVKLWVYNDDSLNNFCGYCEDSAFRNVYISHADMKLVTTTTDTVSTSEFCMGDTVLFWDSTYCTAPLMRWFVDILDSNRSNIDLDTAFWLMRHYFQSQNGYSGVYDSIKTTWSPRPSANVDNEYDDALRYIGKTYSPRGHEYKISPFPNYTYEIDSSIAYQVTTIPHPFAFHFKREGVYYLELNNIDLLGCGNGDTSFFHGLHESGISDSTFHGRTFTKRIEVFPPSTPGAIFPKEICAGDSIQFLDSSSTIEPYGHLKITDYLWSCVGILDTARNPWYVIPAGGSYDVSLGVTNEKGCVGSTVFKKALTVNATNATWVTASGLYEACNKTRFTCGSRVNTYPAQSTSLKYEWHVNNGRFLWNTKPVVSGRNCVCSFDVDTTRYVQITLIVTDTLTGCRSSYTDSILIRKPKAEFIATERSSICPPLQTTYIDQSTVSEHFGNSYIDKWEWILEDYEDTAISIMQQPNFIYNYAGYYDAALVVTDNFGCTDTNYKADYIHVEGPYGDFECDTTEGCLPLKVTFTLHLNDADTVILIAGDGGNVGVNVKGDTLKDIAYVYQAPGFYLSSVQMIKWVTDSSGHTYKCSRTLVSKDTIWAVEINPWFTTKDIYCVGTIPFTNETDSSHSRVKPFDFQLKNFWDYGNGKNDSTNFHGQSYYDSAGTYAVTYTAEAKHCRQSATRSIEVMDYPDIDITHSDTTACVSMIATFEATNLCGEEKDFTWTFQDGVQLNGNPVKREFTQSNYYHYNLTVAFNAENCFKNYPDSVLISAWISPTAEFEIKNNSGQILTDAVRGLPARETAYFNDLSIAGDAPISFWQWHFGNGDSTALTAAPGNTTYAYSDISGYLDVLLAVEDDHHCKDTIRHQILVLETFR